MPLIHPRHNPLKGWQVDRETIQFLGHNLQRPESTFMTGHALHVDGGAFA